MATAYAPGFTWGAPMPPPKSNKNEYYVCELKWNGWYCAPQPSPQVSSQGSPHVFCTKLIPVPNYVPSFLERPYVWLEMKKLNVSVTK